jgi:SAM-dependent methyltransferase
MKKLLDESILEQSSIVANSLMNRERRCLGGNSYEKELSFEILEFLKKRIEGEEQVRWLDLCCGQGKALIEAANILAKQNLNSKLKITGVDLVLMFATQPPELNFLHLLESSFENFQPNHEFDLITCVHGLHYIGDKLAFLQKTASWLKDDGIFLANLDLANFRFVDGRSAGKVIVKEWRKDGFEYNSKKHLIICRGKKEVEFKFDYLGADDQAGPNYTGQAVVNSYYITR